MSDPFGEAETKKIETVDDCFEKVPNYNMETLKYPQELKSKFPEFAAKLKNDVYSKKEKEKVEIDGRQYWWSNFNNVVNFNRSMEGSGGKGGMKPSGTTVYVPKNVSIVGPNDVTQALNNVPEGLFKRIIHVYENPQTKTPEFVLEAYQIVKVFPQTLNIKKQEPEKKEDPL